MPMANPIFILAPPRCFTSVVCAMIGQHPQMYAFPETHLFTAESVGQLWGADLGGPLLRSGLKRAVAQLYFGEQTSASIMEATSWLRRRASLTTGAIFELLAERVYPLIPVEKTPRTAFRIIFMRRMFRMFPNARFLHLTRHPRGHGGSNIKHARQPGGGVLPSDHWMFCPPDYPRPAARKKVEQQSAKILDPQLGWMVHNMNICKFLEILPDEQKLRMAGEDLLSDPRAHLRQIADWLKLRTDPKALESMLHPEQSPYAFIGPPDAERGNSITFLENPKLVPGEQPAHSLEGPLDWRIDGEGFSNEVKELAREFGYS
jgi:hypothetical protein